jgi:hypothetical protein
MHSLLHFDIQLLVLSLPYSLLQLVIKLLALILLNDMLHLWTAIMAMSAMPFTAKRERDNRCNLLQNATKTRQ